MTELEEFALATKGLLPSVTLEELKKRLKASGWKIVWPEEFDCYFENGFEPLVYVESIDNYVFRWPGGRA